MEDKKKENVFKKIKRWWKEDLTEDDRDIFKIAGIWFVDGTLLGTLITTCAKDRKIKKVANQAIAAGYLQGQMDAYKEMAQNPQYKQVGIYSNQATKKFDIKH